MWTWILSACLTWICISQAAARPKFMVTIPAVIEAGSEARFCVDFKKPNETSTMTILLVSQEMNKTIFQKTSDTPFLQCGLFQAPAVENEMILDLEVVVQGQTFLYREAIREIMFKSYKPMTFIQTDKPIYLPGQTVKFRVVTMDTKFTPVNEMYNIEIEDPNRNRIGQWADQTSNGTILQLSYSLNPEAREGNYRVIVHVDDREIYHDFKVEKYVLPKFGVKVEAHDQISIGQQEFTAVVCATYTYGQPVPGKAEVELCRPLWQDVPDIIAPCHKESKQMDKTGCATFTFKMSDFSTLTQTILTDELHLNAKVEEDGTGITQPQGKVIFLSYVIGKLSFIETPKVYEAQSVIEGKVKALYFNSTPIPDMLVYMFEGRWSLRNILNLTTDSDGVANFSFKTSSISKRYTKFKACANPAPESSYYKTPHYEEEEHHLSLVQEATVDTKTVSSLEVKKTENPLLCNGENHITIHYTVVGETAGPVDLMYLILSRAAIIKEGLVSVQVLDSPVTEGEIFFKLDVTPEMAPLLQVLVYTVLPSETVIAHSADFTTKKCFRNKVFLKFSPSTAIPGEKNTLQVSAMPGSLCGVSAIDQSVRIKEPGKQLNADKMFDLLPVKKAQLHDECSKDDITYTVFKNLGLKMATNLLTNIPVSACIYDEEGSSSPMYYDYDSGTSNLESAAGDNFASGPSVPPPIQTIRSFFPETWIWDLVEVGDSGREDVSLTVPDTITTWETEAFCLSSSGFGLAPPKKLKVFQPFFLEISLPYSIVRGERFVLKATVFNYLSRCIMVSVTPSPSSDYTLTPNPDEEYSSCVCANGRKTFHWTMDASVLEVVNVTVSAEAVASQASCGNDIVSVPERGRIDVVTRSLIIKAEGTEVTKTYNWLLCPKGETLTEDIQLQLPDNVIFGSARSSVSVLGDILGRALKNLDGLLRMPYGCGEQNMALLAPNIYILEYLKNTNQLTVAIKEKAFPFLVSGYQRQLNYKHSDGAYSTFGAGNSLENTWLTAFVLRAFVQAKSFVFIDQSTIEQAKNWLKSKQKSNGCFEQSGKLFHNRMKGGVSDEVTLSAYITASLLEMKLLPSDLVLKKSLSCLRKAIDESMKTNTYTTALLAYVFSLARDTETRALLLQHLDKIASQEGDVLHWSQTSADTSASLSVEISSYVLLAKLTSPEPSAADLGYAVRIVRWLAHQQNSYGGFSSTQDTVVALQALARYSTLVFTQEGSSTVTVKSSEGDEVFHVDQSNRLLYQERALQDVMGKYSLEVNGTACVSAQMSLNYNIPTPVEESSLSIKVTPEANCNSLRQKITLKLQSLYSGNEATTNMVLVDVTMLSGFIPDPESLRKLKEALLVDRVEQKDDHVIIYIKELTKGIPIDHVLELTQEVQVQNLKPALLKIYDYYQPSDNQETEYSYPCDTQ